MIWGLAAYLMWGLFPAFFPLLQPASPTEILAHRFVWTLVFMLLLLAAVRGLKQMRTITGRQWAIVTAAALLISVNWGLYIYAVNNDHVADAALGYFINPLVSVLLGVDRPAREATPPAAGVRRHRDSRRRRSYRGAGFAANHFFGIGV